jgi:RNA polymerase sigma-70 factor (ECF subfamily)
MPPPEENDERSDAALLDAYRSGDDDALSALLRRYAPAIHRFGMKMCRDPEDAKDVLQETLLAAARGAREFRGASTLSTWLYTIARSFCIKKRRGARVDMEPLDEAGAVGIASSDRPPDEAAADREIGAALEEAIQALAPAYREVLLLRDVEGLSATEVAGVLGIGVDAVKSRLHRARVAVRARIAPLLSPPTAPRGAACPDVVTMLSRYLEGEIGQAECAEMDRHVATCARCTAECDSLRRVLSMCKNEARAGVVGPEIQAAVQKALRELAGHRA